MKDKLRRILDHIDTYLSTGNVKDSYDLWCILSALRGPDSGDTLVKGCTTSVIRAVAFPKTAEVSNELGGRVCASMTQDTEMLLFLRQKHVDIAMTGHFEGHVQQAFEALGLELNKVNTFKLQETK